ncbi:Zn-dependent alcohol dehydrogenase [Amycolatopsis jejuensis]|uniref:Zn-dependent alcohol dehydrogenase n=1 Tax=Amycolatopsis jejuensis TaxID=330084 RepID=UPI001B80A38D|nr:Zn-dependent alcohol dehydrogenase [Amycolatopsis jejuensis]
MLDDIEVHPPGPGEVRVRLFASGVCHSDLSTRNGKMGESPFLPAILGHEGAGVVVETGPGVTEVAEGDHVILSWVSVCGACKFCLGGQQNLCSRGSLGQPVARFSIGDRDCYAAIGLATFGTETVVGQNACIKIAGDVPLEVGALIGCGVMTGVGAAINTAKVWPGANVAIIGCGGVGVNVIQGARIAGAANIVAVDTVDRKLKSAQELGATHGIHPHEVPQAIDEITGGDGFDVVFEAIGSSTTVKAAWDATRRGGTTVMVGIAAADDMLALSPLELVGSEKRLVGSLYGSADVRRDFPRLVELWRQGKLEVEALISRRITLDEINVAFRAMDAGEVLRSVIVY